jgi:predicted Zn-dependent peptidase
VLTAFQQQGPTAAEMEKARASLQFNFVSSLESNLGKAELLNSSAVYYGDPNYYMKQYQRFNTITADEVKRAAQKYFGPNRVVLSIVPVGKPELAATPERSTKVVVGADGGHYNLGDAQ